MRFVLDETSWKVPHQQVESYAEMVDQMLDRIESLDQGGHECLFSDDLFNEPIFGELTFYELYSRDSPVEIPPDVRLRVAVTFNKMRSWQEADDPWPADLEVQVGDAPKEYAPSIAWAHAQAVQNVSDSIPCISHNRWRCSGINEVQVQNTTAQIWFVSTDNDLRDFFRWNIAHRTKRPEELAQLMRDAFPALDFVEDCFAGMKDMSRPYRDIIADVVAHLSVLSDFGRPIFAGPWQEAAARLGAKKVDASDENGRTKADAEARIARTRNFEEKEFIFWWHTKIEPHQNRIHFCPDRVSVGGNVIVGIFCKHLK